MKKKKIWKTTNANNINNVKQVGSVKTSVNILENSIYMMEGIEEYIKNDEQYAILKMIKNVHDFVKVRITGLDANKEKIIVAGQFATGDGLQMTVNWKDMFNDNECKEALDCLKLEYTMKYECDTTFEPCGSAREIFGTDDDTPMCIMVMSRKEK